MKKDIGRKRLERAKTSRMKVMQRRQELRKAVDENNKKQRLEYRSRRRQKPIQREDFVVHAQQTEVDEHFDVVVNREILVDNIVALKAMEQEFIDRDARQTEKVEVSDERDPE